MTFYATGEGLTDSGNVTGAAAQAPYPHPLASISLAIAGVNADILYAGSAPGMVGVLQVNARVPGEMEKARAAGEEILRWCVDCGGSITGEHGVGMEKINQMCSQFDHASLLAFHRVKKAFDAEGLLNPGKAVPSLHRCAEYGRMHVHQGALKFPELERF